MQKMIVDGVGYSYSLGTMTVYIYKNGNCRTVAELEITDRDFDPEEESDYMRSIAEEIALERGYEVIADRGGCFYGCKK